MLNKKTLLVALLLIAIILAGVIVIKIYYRQSDSKRYEGYVTEENSDTLEDSSTSYNFDN